METIYSYEKGDSRLPVVRLLYVRQNDIHDDFSPAMRLLPHAEVFYVLDGYGRICVEDREILVKKDDLVVIGSNIHHVEEKIENQPFHYLTLGVEGLNLCKKRLPSLTALHPDESETNSLTDFLDTYTFQYNCAESPEIDYLITHIAEEVEQQRPCYEAFVSSMLRLLVLHILRVSDTEILLDSDSETNKQLQYIKRFLDTHYSYDLRLDELSKMSYLNKYYLVHEFKKKYGLTPIDYLLRRRIETAKDLLINSNYNMEQIAEMVGFNSQSYFNQVFKKKTHTTPTKYKRSHQR